MINEDEELALGYLLDPTFELTNTAGKPLTDGWINVYVHGTRNKYYCYSDWNGNLHPFNIPLDGLGSNIVLASPQFTYDVYVYNKYGTLQMSRYNVSPVGVGEVSVSGINTITSSDGTVEVSQYGDTFDLSIQDTVTAVEDLEERFDELSSAVSALDVQADWEQTDENAHDFIKNKPDLTVYATEEELAAVSGILQLEIDAVSANPRVVTVTYSDDTWDDVAAAYARMQAGEIDYIIATDGNDTDGHVYAPLTRFVPGEYALFVAPCNDNVTRYGYGKRRQDTTYTIYSNDTWIGRNYLPFNGRLFAGDNISISVQNEDYVISTSATPQVNSDWNAVSGVAEILNKPDLTVYVTHDEMATAVSALSVQSDWDEDDPSSKAYILNKPEEKDLVAGDGIEITVSGTSVIISSDNPVVTGYATEVELAAVSGTLQLEIDAVSSNPRVKTVEYGVDEWSDVVSAMDGVSSGKYDYVVMKYSANGTDLYAPLAKYTPGSAAYFVCPAHGTGTTYGYGTRRTTDVYTINSGDMWFDYTVRPFQGRLIGAGNVSVTVDGEDYIVSGAGGSFEQVNADWNATSGVAEILNKPETVEIETVGVSAGSGIAITEVASGIVISCTVTGGSFEQVNSDWEATSGVAEILNKPETIEIETVGVSAGSGIAITEAASGIVISCTVTGGPDYTAGSGIDITNDVISAKVDGTTMGINASGCLVSNKKFVDLTYSSSTWADFGAAYTKLQNGEIDGIRAVYSDMGGEFYADYVYSSKGPFGGALTNAVFVTPAYVGSNPTGYNIRRTTRIFTLSRGSTWTSDYSYGFDGKIIAGSNVTVAVSGADYIVSAQGGGSSYTAGDNIDITNDVISVTGTGELIAGDNITITASGTDFVISSQGGSGGSTYSAGSGIDITNDVISVDNTVALKTDIPTYTAGQGISVSGGVISVLYTTIDFTGTITCPTCNGTGSVTSTDSCPTCGGQGGYESYETCSECGGTGNVSCGTCNGSGHTDEPCTTCGGHGTVMCESCGGAGCETCDYNGYVTCMDCQGTGYTICSICGGSGEYSCGSCGGTGGYSTYNTCSECNGTGTVELQGICSTCNGTGQIEE